MTNPFAWSPGSKQLEADTGGWQPMETAPTDRQILVRRHNDVFYEYDVVWWSSGDDPYPWHANNNNSYPEGRLDDWREIPGQGVDMTGKT